MSEQYVDDTAKYAAKLESELNRQVIDYERDGNELMLSYDDIDLLEVEIEPEDTEKPLSEMVSDMEDLIDDYLDSIDDDLAARIRRKRVKKRTDKFIDDQ
jgi:hypothetical protein